MFNCPVMLSITSPLHSLSRRRKTKSSDSLFWSKLRREYNPSVASFSWKTFHGDRRQHFSLRPCWQKLFRRQFKGQKHGRVWFQSSHLNVAAAPGGRREGDEEEEEEEQLCAQRPRHPDAQFPGAELGKNSAVCEGPAFIAARTRTRTRTRIDKTQSFWSCVKRLYGDNASKHTCGRGKIQRTCRIWLKNNVTICKMDLISARLKHEWAFICKGGWLKDPNLITARASASFLTSFWLTQTFLAAWTWNLVSWMNWGLWLERRSLLQSSGD